MKRPHHFRIEVKTIRRGANGSATAKGAYIGAIRIVDERTGVVHDYRARQSTVLRTELVLPLASKSEVTVEALWNLAERSEAHPRAWVSREFLLSIPHELTDKEAWELARGFAEWVCADYQIAGQLALHTHGKGDYRNKHAHFQVTRREYTSDGFGRILRDWDIKTTSGPIMETLRETWAKHVNRALEKAGWSKRVDHRSYERQGLRHLIPGVPFGKYGQMLRQRRRKVMRSFVRNLDGDWLERVFEFLTAASTECESVPLPGVEGFATVIREPRGEVAIDRDFWWALKERIERLQQRKTQLNGEEKRLLQCYSEFAFIAEPLVETTSDASFRAVASEILNQLVAALHKSARELDGSNRHAAFQTYLGMSLPRGLVSTFIKFDRDESRLKPKQFVQNWGTAGESVASDLRELDETLAQFEGLVKEHSKDDQQLPKTPGL